MDDARSGDQTMTKDMPSFEVPPQVRDMAEKSVDQAKQAFDAFMQQAHKAVTTMEGQAAAMQSSGKEMGGKAMSFAEANMTASFDFAQKLMKAKDVNEVVKLQSEFVTTQMKAFGEQAKEIGTAATKVVTDMAKPRV
jgi:phasin